MVYLITYSRADLDKIPTREAFAEAVKGAWAATTGANLQQWTVAREMHASSDMRTVNILEKPARWLSVRNFLDDNNGIKVNFSSNHNTHYTAFKYITKGDTECILSKGHPDLQECNPPRTEQVISGRKRKANVKAGGPAKKGRKRGLSVYDVVQFVQSKKNNKSPPTDVRRGHPKWWGEEDLAEFICNRGGKVVDECLAIAHELDTATDNDLGPPIHIIKDGAFLLTSKLGSCEVFLSNKKRTWW